MGAEGFGPVRACRAQTAISNQSGAHSGAHDPELAELLRSWPNLHINTSYAERSNLTMRMGMRRFTRLTNAFSKKIENHKHNIALHFMHYNFCRVHQALRVTPAMEAGLTDHVWELEELVALLD
jgi:hypothetical protein